MTKNLSRRKGRAILNTFGLILAVAVIVSTMTISRAVQTHIGEEVEKYGPNVVVQPVAQTLSIPYGSVVVGQSTIPEMYVDAIFGIKNSKNVRVVSPKVYGQATVKNNTFLVVGIIPQKERMLRTWWNVEGALPADDADEMLVGSAVMKVLGLRVNDTLPLGGRAIKVTGSLDETGSADDYTVYIPLHTAQVVLGTGKVVNLIDVGALCNDCPVEEIARQITAAIPGVKAVPVKQAVETRMKAVGETTSFSLMLAAIVLVAGGAGVMNTMLGSVNERRKEIGVFMSLGADDRWLYGMFLVEAAIIGIVGGLIGAGLGLGASLVASPLLLGYAVKAVDVPLLVLPGAISLSLVACVVASLYPTWRAAQIDPVKALKTV